VLKMEITGEKKVHRCMSMGFSDQYFALQYVVNFSHFLNKNSSLLVAD
jgi:hypothetical protein